MDRRAFLKSAGVGAAVMALGGCLEDAVVTGGIEGVSRPNVLWIVVEDMSPDWGCFGQSLISTPNIDRLASEGVKFTNAFVTCPVCSPSRSSMVTGMFQGSIGSHHHRSSYPGSEVVLPERMKLLAEYFKDAGYYTANGGPKKTVYENDPSGKSKQLGKTDYNFVWDKTVYDDSDWSGRGEGQPFFAQIQLQGGKFRNAKVESPVRPEDVVLPPYYSDDTVIREDWARYLNSVIYLDKQVGEILQRLEDEGIAEETAVILWTDHGISHARGKQFLYDEGLHVPLIMRWPGEIEAGSVRDDLVSHIDISATSLYFGGIKVPSYMQGRSLFAAGYGEREYIYAGRDRCDETLDFIRCIRTRRYKYIRNFFPERAYLQANRYKDNKEIIKRLKKLNSQGKLMGAESLILSESRPVEELYDLEKDPYEINNLCKDGVYAETLMMIRWKLDEVMLEFRDLGLIPEPSLEELSKNYKSRYGICEDEVGRELLSDIIELLEPGKDVDEGIDNYRSALRDKRSAIRWWGARRLADMKAFKAVGELTAGLGDESGGVRVECARALCLMDKEDVGLPVLINESQDSDQVVRHYAFLAMEDIGDRAAGATEIIRRARKDEYEYVQRLTVRLANHFKK